MFLRSAAKSAIKILLVSFCSIGLLGFLGSCAKKGSQPAATNDVVSEVATEAAPAQSPGADYKIHAGDVLHVTVWREEDLDLDVLVQPDGRFSYPLAGHVQAKGRSVEEIQNDLASRIQRYIPDPVVTVSAVKIGGNTIYVVGKVKEPGEFVVAHDIDVIQAISLAGGATTFAKLNKIKVLRRVNGDQTTIPFRYADIESGKRLDQNIILQSGDTVVVP